MAISRHTKLAQWYRRCCTEECCSATRCKKLVQPIVDSTKIVSSFGFDSRKGKFAARWPSISGMNGLKPASRFPSPRVFKRRRERMYFVSSVSTGENFVPLSAVVPGSAHANRKQFDVAYAYGIQREDGSYIRLVCADELPDMQSTTPPRWTSTSQQTSLWIHQH